MRAGLIGLHGFGRTLAAAMERLGVEIAWGYHPDPARARAWDAARGVSDLGRALEDASVPAVLIASPTPHHADHAAACAAAGKAIFVEKPLAATAEACDRMLAAAEAARVVGMCGHNVRRSAAARAIAKLIADGRLGRLVDLELTLSHGGAYAFRMGNGRGHQRGHREGPLSALGVHPFDLVHAWAGPVRSATGLLRNLAGVTEAPDAAAALLELENGAAALVKTDYIVPSEERFVVTGTDGIVTWARGELTLRVGRDVDRVPSQPQRLACEPVDTVAEELREFIRAVEQDDPAAVETPLATGAAAVYVLEACYRSAVDRRPVPLAEFNRYRAAVGAGTAAVAASP
ncbi:MAG: Gfo/Idh/MocA family oxidoreductase [Gemmatimonadales bacterium]|nr:Gfo/Idh/MocA family oxidoreductase [Gemmatimonadales bacterium]